MKTKKQKLAEILNHNTRRTAPVLPTEDTSLTVIQHMILSQFIQNLNKEVVKQYISDLNTPTVQKLLIADYASRDDPFPYLRDASIEPASWGFFAIYNNPQISSTLATLLSRKPRLNNEVKDDMVFQVFNHFASHDFSKYQPFIKDEYRALMALDTIPGDLEQTKLNIEELGAQYRISKGTLDSLAAIQKIPDLRYR